jgi:O-acetylhomoserine/O-acetylserine sulfhydrylase-like pyridoxal-dependent enzyme
MQERNIECRWVKGRHQPRRMGGQNRRNTRFLYGELPSNPQLGFFDIQAVADLAHSHNLPLICDSTVATPPCCAPSATAPTSSSSR